MKTYEVTQHAKRRCAERLNKPIEHAENHLNQLMQTAVFVGVTQNVRGESGRIFDHYKTRTRLLLAANEDTVVTVYSMDTLKGDIPVPTQAMQTFATAGALTGVIRATIERELRKAQRTFRRSYRQYALTLADLNVEIAELFRNKVRCKHPGTQTIIQSQIDVLEDEAKAIQNAMQTQEAEYRAVEAEAKAFISVEVTI